MKKTVKNSGFVDGFETILSRKKRRNGVLEDSSDNIDMKEEYLMEKTSFNYGKSGALTYRNLNQTPKNLHVKIKKALDKPLGKINFLDSSNNDNVLLNVPLELPPFLKNLVTIFVYKSFILDIGLDKIAEKTFQKKYMMVRKLFSGINNFEGAFTSLKFAKIIKVMFTSELSLAQIFKKAKDIKIIVNTNLKKSTGHSNQAVVIKKIPIRTLAETVHAVFSEFRFIKLIKIQLVKLWQKAVIKFDNVDYADLVAAKWSILIRKDIVCITRANMNKKS
ncbi:hypothetical protein G9A89_001079 [Geosiphon pyriformis]|nr:hypothetical protein G9A89_001079 [Geosiphon pyriformis]